MLTKFEKQQLLNKHAKNFAADKHETRAPFQGIRYEKDGTAYVTDTHVLLRMKDVSPFTEPHTLHAVTGAEIEGVYVSQEGMDTFFKRDPENKIVLCTEQIIETTRYAKIAQMIRKETKSSIKIVDLNLYMNEASLSILPEDQSFNFKAIIGSTVKEQSEVWHLNADYLHNALSLFKDVKTESLTIKLGHRYDPIIFTDEENGIDALILPIRRA